MRAEHQQPWKNMLLNNRLKGKAPRTTCRLPEGHGTTAIMIPEAARSHTGGEGMQGIYEWVHHKAHCGF